MSRLKAPFPWFGGKSMAAQEIWARLGDVPSYVEPFVGSAAVLLARPHEGRRNEIVNDADGMLANFWRAVAHAPDEVARHADWPVHEADLHARHVWLLGQRERITERLMGDPDFFDAKVAGWWVWGVSASIAGAGVWCSGKGPWGSVDGVFQRVAGPGIQRIKPNLKRPHGVHARRCAALSEVFAELAQRLRYVRVACGDVMRVLTDGVLFYGRNDRAICGVVLDPPYRSDKEIQYASACDHVALEAWCRANGERPDLRIALCGWAGDYDLPGWSVHEWMGHGGYGRQGRSKIKSQRDDKRPRERIWFSPHCLSSQRLDVQIAPENAP